MSEVGRNRLDKSLHLNLKGKESDKIKVKKNKDREVVISIKLDPSDKMGIESAVNEVRLVVKKDKLLSWQLITNTVMRDSRKSRSGYEVTSLGLKEHEPQALVPALKAFIAADRLRDTEQKSDELIRALKRSIVATSLHVDQVAQSAIPNFTPKASANLLVARDTNSIKGVQTVAQFYPEEKRGIDVTEKTQGVANKFFDSIDFNQALEVEQYLGFVQKGLEKLDAITKLGPRATAVKNSLISSLKEMEEKLQNSVSMVGITETITKASELIDSVNYMLDQEDVGMLNSGAESGVARSRLELLSDIIDSDKILKAESDRKESGSIHMDDIALGDDTFKSYVFDFLGMHAKTDHESVMNNTKDLLEDLQRMNTKRSGKTIRERFQSLHKKCLAYDWGSCVYVDSSEDIQFLNAEQQKIELIKLFNGYNSSLEPTTLGDGGLYIERSKEEATPLAIAYDRDVSSQEEIEGLLVLESRELRSIHEKLVNSNAPNSEFLDSIDVAIHMSRNNQLVALEKYIQDNMKAIEGEEATKAEQILARINMITKKEPLIEFDGNGFPFVSSAEFEDLFRDALPIARVAEMNARLQALQEVISFVSEGNEKEALRACPDYRSLESAFRQYWENHKIGHDDKRHSLRQELDPSKMKESLFIYYGYRRAEELLEERDKVKAEREDFYLALRGELKSAAFREDLHMDEDTDLYDQLLQLINDPALEARVDELGLAASGYVSGFNNISFDVSKHTDLTEIDRSFEIAQEAIERYREKMDEYTTLLRSGIPKILKQTDFVGFKALGDDIESISGDSTADGGIEWSDDEDEDEDKNDRPYTSGTVEYPQIYPQNSPFEQAPPKRFVSLRSPSEQNTTKEEDRSYDATRSASPVTHPDVDDAKTAARGRSSSARVDAFSKEKHDTSGLSEGELGDGEDDISSELGSSKGLSVNSIDWYEESDDPDPHVDIYPLRVVSKDPEGGGRTRRRSFGDDSHSASESSSRKPSLRKVKSEGEFTGSQDSWPQYDNVPWDLRSVIKIVSSTKGSDGEAGSPDSSTRSPYWGEDGEEEKKRTNK